MKPINLFVGYDPREKEGFHVFMHSVLKQATRTVSFTPLAQMGLDTGSNTFTVSRFLTAYFMGYQGHAIFADGCDMLCMADIAKLDDLFDPSYAVQVVQHPEYDSLHDRKYIGTEMECAQSNYPRKNWASLMLINAEHPAWKAMTLDAVAESKPIDLLQLKFIDDKDIGALPPEWNVLIDEGQDDTDAKIIHWTAGVPFFSHYQNARRSRDWFSNRYEMTGTRL